MKTLYKKTIEVTGCYIGDPCYASIDNSDDFYAEWGKLGYKDGPDLGNQALIYGTSYGDGCYQGFRRGYLSAGNYDFAKIHLGVDAGVLGVVNAANAGDNSLDLMIHLPNARRVTYTVRSLKHGRKHEWRVVNDDGSEMFVCCYS